MLFAFCTEAINRQIRERALFLLFLARHPFRDDSVIHLLCFSIAESTISSKSCLFFIPSFRYMRVLWVAAVPSEMAKQILYFREAIAASKKGKHLRLPLG